MKFFCAAFAIMGCRKKVSTKGGFCCDEHAMLATRRIADAPRHRWPGAERPNDEIYHDSKYRKNRRIVLSKNPVCQVCNENPSTQVHHPDPPKGNIDMLQDINNMVAVCFRCHLRITSMENKPQ